MSEEKPVKVYVPTKRHSTKPIDVETVRATAEIEPLPPARVGRPPAMTQTKTVTTTKSGSSDDLAEYIKPHGVRIIEEMLALAFSPSTKENIRLALFNSLLDRGYGKPTQMTESTSTVADIGMLHLDALRNASK